MSLDQQIAAHFERQNAMPLAGFCGLSPVQMHALLYDPLGPGSPVRLRNELPEAVMMQVPFLLLTEAFLEVVQREGSIKLTPLGALPRKYLHELYAHQFILEEQIEAGYVKLSREIDSLAITTLHTTATLAGLVRKVHGKLTLTKKGTQLLQPGQRPALLRLVLDIFTSRFNWAFHDMYPSPSAGQFGWAYSVYLLARFGDDLQSIRFYADKYQKALPLLLSDFADATYATPQEQLASCYCVRVFDRALNWFGLVVIKHKKHRLDVESSQVGAAPLLPLVFEVQQGPEEAIL